jgi:cathepsin L
MLGKLEIPNADESKSPEVENLRKKVQRAREKRRAMVEQWWQRFNQPPTRKKWLPCDPPQTDCKPTKYIQEPVPLVLGNRKFKTKEELEQHRAEVQSVYARYQDLQNTSDWHRLPKFDWRTRGLDVGKVMQQGECGSCWAFASVSTYQCAWNLEQMRLGEDFLELVIDYNQFRRQPSVQQLLNCMSKKKGDCDWGWHGSAFAFMVNNHVPHIPDRLVWNKEYTAAIEEYTGKKSACINPFRKLDVKRSGIVGVPVDGRESNFRLRRDSDRFVTAFDRALTWGYVNEPFDEMPSVEKLKTALIEHGPLAVSIYSDYCFSVYKSGVFNGKNKQSVNHVVVLIGWDDEKKAWLIKNSWGEDWGEKGFGWVEYESNNVGLFAAWIQPTPITLGL